MSGRLATFDPCAVGSAPWGRGVLKVFLGVVSPWFGGWAVTVMNF